MTDCIVDSILLGLAGGLLNFLLSRKDCCCIPLSFCGEVVWLVCSSDLLLDCLLDHLLDPLVRLEMSVPETDALDFAGGETTQGTAAEV